MLYSKLKEAGLTEKEAKVYLAVLELGEASIVRIVQKSAIKRSTVYEMLELLKEKGLISVTKKKSRTLYLGEDPRKLVNQLEEKKKTINEIMPELLSYMNLIDNKPKVRYFEGENGIKEVFNDTLRFPDSEVCLWFSENYAKTIGQDYIGDYYVPQRVEKKIWTRAIHPDNEAIRQLVSDGEKVLRISRFVKNPKFEMPVEIMLYSGSRVGIISFEEKMAMIIESQKVYRSLKGIFEVMWAGLPER